MYFATLKGIGMIRKLGNWVPHELTEIFLHHPPYTPNIAPLYYLLFRSMQSALSGERFSSAEDL